jgi:hypothetical protein
MANSPVALDGFLQLHGALAGGVLSEAFQEQVTVIPSTFLRLVAAIIVWPPIPKSLKKLGFQKKKPFPAGKRILTLLQLRQDWSLSGKLYPIRAEFQTITIIQLSRLGESSEEVIENIALVENTYLPNTSTILQELQLIFLQHEARASQLFHTNRNWSMKTGSILVVPNILTCWWL